MHRKPAPERRASGRIPKKLWVDVCLRKEKQRVRALDVSRHGLFLEMEHPPEPGRVVLLRVHLPGGPFEAMATIARHAYWTVATMPGAGVKLYCLASAAKARWDRFVAEAEGTAVTAVERKEQGAATFLVQLSTKNHLEEFFRRHVANRQIVYVTPSVRRLGAEVVVILVHPTTRDELALRGVVRDFDKDRPLFMGVELEEPGPVVKRRFEAFMQKGADAALVGGEDAGFAQYAFYSPRIERAPTDPPMLLHEDDIVVGELMDRPELELLDRRALFDFDWSADDESKT